MKGLFSIASFLLAGSVLTSANDPQIPQIPKSCPSENSLDINTFLKHETNCSMFYICQKGEKIARLCPLLDKEGNRLHFNPQLQICDWPENVKCESTIRTVLFKSVDGDNNQKDPEASTPSWQNPGTCIGTCPATNPEDIVIHLPNKDCTKFCKCDGTHPVVTSCPAGLHYNSQLGVCDWPQSAKCDKKVESPVPGEIFETLEEDTETSTASWQNPATCKGSCPARDPENQAVLLGNRDCSKYCICGGGKATVNVCPPGLHFSVQAQVCTWPGEASCEDDEKLEKNEKADGSGIQGRNEIIPLNFVGKEDEEENEVKEGVELKNSNLLEDESFEVSTPSWQNPRTCQGKCPDRDPVDHAILLQNYDCTKYCMCSNGRPIVNICPEGLEFSLKDQGCTWPGEAQCPQPISFFRMKR